MAASAEKTIAEAIEALPEVLRDAAARWFERAGDDLPAHLVGQSARVVACSEFAAAALLQHRDWFLRNVAAFESAAGPSPGTTDDTAPVDEVKAELRRVRNRALLRIVWREVCGRADLDETLEDLSALADSMLDVAARYAEGHLAPRYGTARGNAGERIPLVILGMGKLGGHELNFSSDIDLIFLYPGDGETDGPKRISAQEYFGRMTRLIIALLDEVTADGFVFRTDTRLRPFGESGPPVVSFAALESYLVQHGRDWERYAYVKARIVGPQPEPAIVEELYDNLLRPFVYRRYLDYGVFESLREMHAMIAAEVKRRELSDNIKLGPGGIREAEFVVQSLQLVRGGNDPGLQSRRLQQVLPRLVGSRGLTAEGAQELGRGYRFLRRAENFIQAIRDQQTHDLPQDAADRARLCLAMGYEDWDTLLQDLDRHRAAVAGQFATVAFRDHGEDTRFDEEVSRLWEANVGESRWAMLLGARGFADAAQAAASLHEFRNAAATRQIHKIAGERLQKFVPKLLVETMNTPHSATALSRTLGVIERVLRRSAYIALLNENRTALTRLVDLCGRSRYIAAQISRSPVLLDELLAPRVISGEVSKDELAEELRQRMLHEDRRDSEAEMQAIVQFQRSAMFRVAVADFNGDLPIMKVSDALTWLAEVVLEEALRVTWRDMTAIHGVPCYEVDGDKREAGFGIVGYGKLGGLELSYGSDLDIVFLHDSHGGKAVTNGEKPLDNTRFFARLVRRLMLFLTTQTGSGELYEVDTRLRPDGRRGLLVSSTEAFERYQEDNAWTWEHQALLRARPVAGSVAIADAFTRIRRDTLVRRVRRDTLRDDVIEMRRKMRGQLDKSDARRFDLKHGAGGIGDIEFLVQYLVLLHASDEPDVIFYSDNIRQLDALVSTACLDAAVGEQLQDCYRDYRLRQHHLALDEQPPLVGADEFAEQRDFVVSLWQEWLDRA